MLATSLRLLGGYVGAFNFRDVGLVGAKRLFRSGCPGKTSVEEFVGTLRAHGIRGVVDLRCPEERTEAGEYHTSLEGIEFVNIPFLTVIREEWVNPQAKDPLSTAKRYLEMIEASGGAPRALFEWLVGHGTSPVLIHCAAGRDRTGLAYALVLGVLGVDRNRIAEDYALSDSVVGDGYGAPAQTMLELWGLIDAKFANLANLLDHLGIAEDLRSRLRTLYS